MRPALTRPGKRSSPPAGWCHCRLTRGSGNGAGTRPRRSGRTGIQLPNRDAAVPQWSADEPAAEDKWLVRPTWEPSRAPTATERISGTWLLVSDDARTSDRLRLLAPQSGGIPDRRGLDRPRDSPPTAPTGSICAQMIRSNSGWCNRRAGADRPDGCITPGGGRTPVPDTMSARRPRRRPGRRRRQRAAPGPGPGRQAATPRVWVVTRGSQSVRRG